MPKIDIIPQDSSFLRFVFGRIMLQFFWHLISKIIFVAIALYIEEYDSKYIVPNFNYRIN